MKSIFSILTTILVSLNTWGNAKVIGNGGDGAAIEFKSIGNRIFKELELSKDDLSFVNISSLKATLEKASVESSIKLLVLNGVPKDALNFPSENKIVLSLDRWNFLSIEAKRTLILHELLGLSGHDDKNYKTSLRLERVARAQLGTCAFQKIVNGEMVDLKKPGLNKVKSVIILGSGAEKVKAEIIQRNGWALLTIETTEEKVSSSQPIDRGVLSLTMNHKSDGIGYRLDCAL